MNLRELKYFVAVADAGGFRQAESTCHVAQSAISKAVGNLEASLGIKLFERGRQGTEITEFGEILASRARPILTELDAVTREFEMLRTGDAGQLRIGASPVAFADVLPPAIRCFSDTWPSVRLEVLEGTYRAMLPELRAGEFDLLLFPAPLELVDPEVRWTPLFTTPLTLLSRRGHPLAGKPRVTPSDMQAYPWVSYTGIGGPAETVRQYFRALGLPSPDFITRTNSVFGIIGLVGSTDALHLMPECLINALVTQDRVVRLTPQVPFQDLHIGIHDRRRFPRSIAARHFVECLQTTVA